MNYTANRMDFHTCVQTMSLSLVCALSAQRPSGVFRLWTLPLVLYNFLSWSRLFETQTSMPTGESRKTVQNRVGLEQRGSRVTSTSTLGGL